MKRTLLALAAVILSGCAGAPVPMKIPVDSSPQGARVYFGTGANESFAATSKQFIGTTPFVWEYQPKGDGTFAMPGALVYSIFVPPVAVFTAEMDGATNASKRIVYHGGTIATGADKVPSAMFFDMHKP